MYLDFDKKITKDILYSIIEKLHDIKYSVVACVSDCGGGNVGLWKELHINIDHTFFSNPVSGQNVYFFADAPHLLKLIRNWLLDHGFNLEDGSVINANPLKDLITNSDTEVSSCYKISKKHLECIGPQRQNVSLAAQLLSHTTTTALKRYQPGPDKKLANDLGHFVEKLNIWFDIFNSYSTTVPIATKKPYGLDIEHQNKILDDVANTMSTMRCKGKTALQIFQKGMIMSISSLKQLFVDMKEKYGIKYITTHKLNQDSLENFFSQMRGRGGLNDHPSPLDAIYRIRMIILGKNPGAVQKNVNTIAHDRDTDEYMVVAKIISSSISISDKKDDSEKENDLSDIESTFSVETNSTSSASTSDTKTATEADGLEYLAGWVAYKLKEKHPGLGQHTYKSQIEHSYCMPSWVSHLSFGGLMQPSRKWEKEAKILNKLFEKFHKNGKIRKGKNITEKLVKIVETKHKDINLEAARCYLRQRLFIRIKYLNEETKQERGIKRKSFDETKHDKHSKKMRKLVT